jgi:hypothetical protein
VAHAPDVTWNLRDPADSRRTNYGSQAGKPVQRPEGQAEGRPGVRSARSSAGARPRGPDPHEGADTSMQPTQATSAVRTTDPRWRTSLRAIATKAAQNPHQEGLRDSSCWTAAHREELATVNLFGAQHVRAGARAS